jgi:hypothetical protein
LIPIDQGCPVADNIHQENTMKAAEPALSQEQADTKEVLRLVSEGKRVTDPELRKRIARRSEAVQGEIRDRFGVVEWAVDLIREGRDED